MTEAEWLACGDLQRLLEFIDARVTLHKALAFAAACDRYIAGPPYPRGVPAPYEEELNDRTQQSNAAKIRTLLRVALGLVHASPDPEEQSSPDWLPRRMLAICDLLRDLFNPFHEAQRNPDWLTANNRAAWNLARTIYAEQEFDRLPILGDALEDAGCTDDSILSHCRGAGPHVRGCWVIDLLLGKE
jgi:hypothetical protein